jgi:hypothetical protein
MIAFIFSLFAATVKILDGEAKAASFDWFGWIVIWLGLGFLILTILALVAGEIAYAVIK